MEGATTEGGDVLVGAVLPLRISLAVRRCVGLVCKKNQEYCSTCE